MSSGCPVDEVRYCGECWDLEQPDAGTPLGISYRESSHAQCLIKSNGRQCVSLGQIELHVFWKEHTLITGCNHLKNISLTHWCVLYFASGASSTNKVFFLLPPLPLVNIPPGGPREAFWGLAGYLKHLQHRPHLMKILRIPTRGKKQEQQIGHLSQMGY